MKLIWIRKAHNYLGVFFAPLLLLFLLTGWWQTMGYGDPDEDDPGKLALYMGKLSRVHTDSYWPPQPENAHSDIWFKSLVVALCAALALSIVSGLVIAWRSNRNKWPLIATLALGILVPFLLLVLKL